MLRRSIWLMAMAGVAIFAVPAHAQQGITAPVTTLNIGQLPKTSTITNDDLFIKRDATAASGYRTQAVKASDFASYLNTQLGIVSGLTAEIIRAQAAEAANAAAVVTERNRAQGVEGVNAGAISAEVTRATAAEGVNATAVTTERTRAVAAEALAFPASSAGTAATKNVGTTLGTVADGSVDPIARGAVQAAGGDASGTVALGRLLSARAQDLINVKDAPFNAKGDTITPNATVSIVAGSTTLTASTATFTADMVGKNITVPGSGASGAPQVTTVAAYVSPTQISLAGASQTALSAVATTLQIGTDDSAAIAAAINYANSFVSAGTRFACVYLPAGNYLVSGTQMPGFVGPGCLKGDGSYRTTVTMTAAYVGDLFWWSEAWAANTYPYAGPRLAASYQRAGAEFDGLTVNGDRASFGQQNALVFYDRNDFVTVRDYTANFVNGRCFYAGAQKNQTQSYLRESRLYSVRCWGTGAPGVPSFELTSQGSSEATNEIAGYGVDVIGSFGPGVVIRNAASSAVRLIDFFGLRVEGTTGADLVDIGDPTMTGQVANLNIYGFRGNGVPAGYSSLRFSAPNAAGMPYAIKVDGVITSGAGTGVNIDAGRSIILRMENIATTGSNIVCSANTNSQIGGNILVDAGGLEQGFSRSIDASCTNLVTQPMMTISQQNSHNGQQAANLGGQANNANALDSATLGGFGIQVTGTYSAGWGSQSNDRGRDAMMCGANGQVSISGDAQQCTTTLRGIATSAASVRLLSNGVTLSAGKTLAIPNAGLAYGIDAKLIAVDVTTPTNSFVAKWSGAHLLTRSGAASTTLLDGVTTAIAPDTTKVNGSVTPSASLAADTTNGSLNATFTPPSGNTDTWHAVLCIGGGTCEVQ